MKQFRAFLLVLFAASLSFADSPKLSGDLKRLKAERPAEETNVIVRFKRHVEGRERSGGVFGDFVD